jgi:hypothetical protein
MTNLQSEALGFWNSFHNWITKNPGFYVGLIAGGAAGWLLHGIF